MYHPERVAKRRVELSRSAMQSAKRSKSASAASTSSSQAKDLGADAQRDLFRLYQHLLSPSNIMQAVCQKLLADPFLV